MELAEALRVIAPLTDPDPSVNERRKMAFGVVYEALRSPKIRMWFAKDQGNRWGEQIEDVINEIVVKLLNGGPKPGLQVRNGEGYLRKMIKNFIIDESRKKKYSVGGKEIAKEEPSDVVQLEEEQRLPGSFEDPLIRNTVTDPARLDEAAQQLQRTKEFMAVVMVPRIAKSLRQDAAKNFKSYVGYLMCGNTVEEIAEKEFGQADAKSKGAVYQQLRRQRQKLFRNADSIFRAARDHGIWPEAIEQVMNGFRAQGAG